MIGTVSLCLILSYIPIPHSLALGQRLSTPPWSCCITVFCPLLELLLFQYLPGLLLGNGYCSYCCYCLIHLLFLRCYCLAASHCITVIVLRSLKCRLIVSIVLAT